MQKASSQRSFLLKATALAVLGLLWPAPAALAKQVSLLAIEIYDGPSGPAYLQLADVLVNGKFEMRDCNPFQAGAVDKSTYGKMGKVILAPGGLLERGRRPALHARPGSSRVHCARQCEVRPQCVFFVVGSCGSSDSHGDSNSSVGRPRWRLAAL
jgi:hypothetical protein